jgi:hypothetical protein
LERLEVNALSPVFGHDNNQKQGRKGSKDTHQAAFVASSLSLLLFFSCSFFVVSLPVCVVFTSHRSCCHRSRPSLCLHLCLPMQTPMPPLPESPKRSTAAAAAAAVPTCSQSYFLFSPPPPPWPHATGNKKKNKSNLAALLFVQFTLLLLVSRLLTRGGRRRARHHRARSPTMPPKPSPSNQPFIRRPSRGGMTPKPRSLHHAPRNPPQVCIKPPCIPALSSAGGKGDKTNNT